MYKRPELSLAQLSMQANALPTDQLAHAYNWFMAETARHGYALFREASNNGCAINGKLVGKYSFRFSLSERMGSPEVCVFLSGVCKFQSHTFNKWAAMLLQAVLRPDKNYNEFEPSKGVEKKAVPSFIGGWKLAEEKRPKSKKPTGSKKSPVAMRQRALANKDLSKPISFVSALPMQEEMDEAQAAKVVESLEEPTVEYSPIAMRMMKKMGYKDGSGLGKAENGIREPIVARRCAMSIGLNQIIDN